MRDIQKLEAGYWLSQCMSFAVHTKVSLLQWYVQTPFLIPFLLISTAFTIVLAMLLKYWNIKTLVKRQKVFLELTPPSFTQKTAYTTQQLFSVLHSAGNQRTFLDKLLGRKIFFSLEIVSTRDEGIRYIVTTTPDEAAVIEQSVRAYLPSVLVKQINDYFSNSIFNHAKIVEFELKNHYALPLARQNVLTQHDPVAYITGMMTKLKPQELISFQIIISPTTSDEVNLLTRMILQNDDVLGYLMKYRFPWYLKPIIFAFKILAKGVNVISSETFLIARELAHGNSEQLGYTNQYDARQQQLRTSGQRPMRVLSAFEQEVITSVQKKIDQKLFETTIRAMVVQNNTSDIKQRIRWIIASLEPFAVHKYQSLQTKRVFFPFLTAMIGQFAFKHRIASSMSNSSSSLLSISEIADLYHFPYSQTTQTEDLVKNKSRQLPAPLSLKKSTTNLDVIIGKNTYGSQETLVGLSAAQRHEHTYIVGKTGMGKSTIIEYMALQDITSGKGLAVVDPHGDMVNHIVSRVPEHRKKDVMYLNPFDKEFPVGLNLLSPGISFPDKEEEREWITSSVLSIFMKITPKHQWGQRMEHILRNATLTALSSRTPTKETAYVSLFAIQKLLTNSSYRKNVVSALQDPILKQFWTNEYALFGKMQQGDIISPIANKLGEFMTSVLSRNILLQEKTTINFADVMNEGKILLVNLSKGQLGEERSAFFGTVITSLIQLAAYSRASIPEEERRDFFVYVDEFQNYATHHFHELFSESRKFKVFFIPAHQNIAQLEDPKMAKIVSGSSGTVITLKAGPDDETFMLPFFSPEVEKGDIVNLPPRHFFMKITNKDSEDAFSAETILVSTEGNDSTREEIITMTRNKYATPKATVVKQLEKLFTDTTKKRRVTMPKPVKNQKINTKKHGV